MPLQSLIATKTLRESRNRTYWGLIISILVFIIVWQFPFTPVGVGPQNYTPLHTILEIISVVISGTIFAVGWQCRRLFGVIPMVLCAAGFLGVALIDIAHILSFKGMPDWVTHSGGGKAIYFWFAARYLAAFSILLLVVEHEQRTYTRGSEWWTLTAIMILFIGVTWLVLFHQESLPVFLVVGKGLTPAKIILEWILILLLIVAMIFAWRKHKNGYLLDYNQIVLALSLSIISELCFTRYSEVTDIFSLLGHIFKLLSYGLLYKAIVTGNLKLISKVFTQGQTLIQQLVDHIQQVFWITTADSGKVLYVSPAYENIWHQPCQELLNSATSWIDVVHPEDQVRIEHNFPNLTTRDTVIEYRIRRPDGSERWIRTKTFPFLDADDTTMRIASVSEDITSSVNAAENLYKKERLLNQAQSIAHLGSWELDVQSRIFDWSDEVYRIFGFEPQMFEASFDKFLASIHPEDKKFVNHFYHESFDLEQESFQFEFRIVRQHDNSTRYVYAKYNHIRNFNGKVVKSIGVIHDITEKKLADETKLKLELNFQKLVNAAPDAIILTNAQHRITLVNSQVERVFGYNRNDLLNRTVEILFSTRYQDIHNNNLQQLEHDPLAKKRVFNMEIFGIKSNGEEFPIDVSISSLETSGELQYTYILRDISARVNIESERRLLQEQLAQAQKIEAIGHLTGGIAHDFNNILGAIIGYASLLKDIVDTNNQNKTTKEQAYISQIQVACTRAKELVAQMMAFSRHNPNIEENSIPTILVQPVIKEVVQLLRSSIPSTIALNYDIGSDEIKARIEPVKLHQILLNLAINSRDAIDSYGRINIVANKEIISNQIQCQSCQEQFSGEYLAIQIRDSGQGISNEIIQKMFEPFFTTKEVGKGTGMGLSMVHGVVHSVGGHITVESSINQGTNIKILLPAIADTETNILEQPKLNSLVSSGILSKIHIMLVDDEQSMLFMLYELLTMYGAEVTIYNHPEDALAAFKRDPNAVDLLITDQTMPDYSGIDMSKEFLAIRPKLPVILCTGYSETVNAKIAEQNGIAAFVYKPLEITQLLEIIQKVTVH